MAIRWKDRIVMVRESGEYDEYRERLTQLIDDQHTRDEIAVIMGWTSFKVDIAVPALGLQSRSGRRQLRRDERQLKMDEAMLKSLVEQRAQEHHWVTAFRRAYGPIGKGFSTA